MARVFTVSIVLSTLVIHGGICDIPCLNKIGQDTNNFINKLNTIVGSETLNQEFVDTHQTDFYDLVGQGIINHCASAGSRNMNAIADIDYIVIPFVLKNQKYDIKVNTDKLFTHVQRPSALLVVNKTTLRPDDIVKKSDMPKRYFFPDDCSDHHVRFNLNNNAAVNKAGQSAFAAYGGAENEFFLDMPVGKSCRAFPGLVLGDVGGWGAAETIIVYTNYKEARKALKAFANNLNHTACSNSGLAVYMVDIQNIPPEQSRLTWSVAIGGVLGFFVPQNLADIPQVTILSDPEIIK